MCVYIKDEQKQKTPQMNGWKENKDKYEWEEIGASS